MASSGRGRGGRGRRGIVSQFREVGGRGSGFYVNEAIRQQHNNQFYQGDGRAVLHSRWNSGRRVATRGLPANHPYIPADHAVFRNVDSEIGADVEEDRVYTRVGYHEDDERSVLFQEVRDEVNTWRQFGTMWDQDTAPINAGQLWRIISRIPTGYAYNIGYGQEGMSLGEFIITLREGANAVNESLSKLHGLFLEGVFHVFTVQHDDNVFYARRRLLYFPLHAVYAYNQFTRMFADNATVEEITEVLRGYFTGSNLLTFVNRQFSGEFDGSEVSVYFISDNVRVVRFTEAPAMLRRVNVVRKNFVRSLRTAGLQEILCFDKSVTANFLFENKQYTLIIPPGGVSCVPYCVYEHLKRYSEGELRSLLRTEHTSHVYLWSWLITDVVYGHMRAVYYPKQSDKVFDKMVNDGFSSKCFKHFQESVTRLTDDALVPVCYYPYCKIRDGRRVWEMKQLGGRRIMPRDIYGVGHVDVSIPNSSSSTTNPVRTVIPIFRIKWDGSLYMVDNSVTSEEEGGRPVAREEDINGMLHAVTIWPTPNVHLFQNVSRWQSFLDVLASASTSVMGHYSAMSVKNVMNIETEVFRKCVDYENDNNGVGGTMMYGDVDGESYVRALERQTERDERNVAIEDDNDGGDNRPVTTEPAPPSSSSSSSSYGVGGNSRRAFYQEKNKDRMVVAFDFETVTCERGHFLEDPLYPAIDADVLPPVYESRLVGKQIPVTVCWSVVPGVVDANTFPDNAEDYPVHYEDGGKKPMECVKDFIEHVVEMAKTREKKVVFLFAHNGAKFDNLILLTFNKWFKVTTILDTNRGILSFGLKVDNVRLRFGDTYALFPGSLHNLCESFKFAAGYSKVTGYDISRFTMKDYLDGDGYEHYAMFKKYAIQDVRALAMLCHTINRMFDFKGEAARRLHFYTEVGGSSSSSSSDLNLDIAENTSRPPLLCYTTNMSFVRMVFGRFMKGSLETSRDLRTTGLPRAVGTSYLRRWITGAIKGGTVVNGGRMGVAVPEMLIPLLQKYQDVGGDDCGVFKECVKEMFCRYPDLGWVNFDITSLYPTVMAQCPMPTGSRVKYMTRVACLDAVDAMFCDECERLLHLCEVHSTPSSSSTRPFGVILVENLTPPKNPTSNVTFLGRKVLYSAERQSLSPKCGGSIVHSFETSEQVSRRLFGDAAVDERKADAFGYVQSFTSVELYIARREGWTFDVVCGMEWSCTYAFKEYVDVIFEMRAQAKADGNECLQQLLKLLLNGLYGVHAQRDLHDRSSILSALPDYLRFVNHKDLRLEDYVRQRTKIIADELKEHIPLPNGQSLLKSAVDHTFGEVCSNNSNRSPNQIGTAVLAWSKYLMWLIFHGIGTHNVVYTDTDSFIIPYSVFSGNANLKAMYDPAGRKLGFFKNDYGTNQRIVYYVAGAKKVKMAITINADTGKLEVKNTCKGYLGAANDTPLETRRKCSHFIADIGLEGHPKESGYVGQQWNRNLAYGVEIDDDVWVRPDRGTYLNFAKEFVVTRDLTPGKGGTIDSKTVFLGGPANTTNNNRPPTTAASSAVIPAGNNFDSVVWKGVWGHFLGGEFAEDPDKFGQLIKKVIDTCYDRCQLKNGDQ